MTSLSLLSVPELVDHFTKGLNETKPIYQVVPEKKVIVKIEESEESDLPEAKSCSACKKNLVKKDKECIMRCCFTCCVAIPNSSCALHAAEKQKIQMENKMIAEAISFEHGIVAKSTFLEENNTLTYSKKRKFKQFLHAEDRFSDVNETVVVWCLWDFGLFKKYSDECFAQVEKQKRQRHLELKRRSR